MYEGNTEEYPALKGIYLNNIRILFKGPARGDNGTYAAQWCNQEFKLIQLGYGLYTMNRVNDELGMGPTPWQ